MQCNPIGLSKVLYNQFIIILGIDDVLWLINGNIEFLCGFPFLSTETIFGKHIEVNKIF